MIHGKFIGAFHNYNEVDHFVIDLIQVHKQTMLICRCFEPLIIYNAKSFFFHVPFKQHCFLKRDNI